MKRRGRRGAAKAASRPFATLLARATSLADVLPQLHQRAISMTNGVCSLLFEHNTRTGAMQATSGYGLDRLPTDPWRPASPEARMVADAFSRTSPTFVPNAEREMPKLAAFTPCG